MTEIKHYETFTFAYEEKKFYPIRLFKEVGKEKDELWVSYNDVSKPLNLFYTPNEIRNILSTSDNEKPKYLIVYIDGKIEMFIYYQSVFSLPAQQSQIRSELSNWFSKTVWPVAICMKGMNGEIDKKCRNEVNSLMQSLYPEEEQIKAKWGILKKWLFKKWGYDSYRKVLDSQFDELKAKIRELNVQKHHDEKSQKSELQLTSASIPFPDEAIPELTPALPENSTAKLDAQVIQSTTTKTNNSGDNFFEKTKSIPFTYSRDGINKTEHLNANKTHNGQYCLLSRALYKIFGFKKTDSFIRKYFSNADFNDESLFILKETPKFVFYYLTNKALERLLSHDDFADGTENRRILMELITFFNGRAISELEKRVAVTKKPSMQLPNVHLSFTNSMKKQIAEQANKSGLTINDYLMQIIDGVIPSPKSATA